MLLRSFYFPFLVLRPHFSFLLSRLISPTFPSYSHPPCSISGAYVKRKQASAPWEGRRSAALCQKSVSRAAAVWPRTAWQGSGTRTRDGGSAWFHLGVCVLVWVSQQISVWENDRAAPGGERNQREGRWKTRRENETRVKGRWNKSVCWCRGWIMNHHMKTNSFNPPS